MVNREDMHPSFDYIFVFIPLFSLCFLSVFVMVNGDGRGR